ncbi:MAG: 50S ribosomal protein L15 [Elusimicrobia bacterium]|nr:50S ribosomal protein L15 [Elusimicrobiota bacterium]MBU2614372.1 50S ribosomal protein L15 [Elusimicrobiota bacterium]
MKLHNLKPAKGSRHKKKILGHGRASGHGASSTRGMKGQRSRSGGTKAPWFEGGQMPLLRRIPKRGFTNQKFKIEYYLVNVDTLENIFETGTEITPELLYEKGLIDNMALGVKILGDGEIKKSFRIKAHKFSRTAAEKIKAAGGTYEEIGISAKQAG